MNIQHVIGGLGNDTLLGNDEDNTMVSNGGNEVIGGRSGKDALIVGDGDDFLYSNNSLDAPAAHGSRDALVGLDGVDTCVRSSQDDDYVDPSCESVFN